MIDNKFINGILQEFKADFKLSDLAESKIYEYLVNYVIISKLHPEAFDDTTTLKDLDVDDGSNFGIDGIAILVNNNLVLSIEDLDILKKSKNLDVRLIFTQSKTSSNYDGGDLYKFIGAVANFFSKTPTIPITEELNYFKNIYEELFKHENARYLSKQSPSVSLFYATTGKPAIDATILGIAKQGEGSIANTVPELKDVKVNLVGADFVIDAYNEIENRFDVTINFK
ncbi:MAG: AIPR family protein, partial [Bacteroidetes bacterium]|nr:AIPR family protein [Bacteroidota bacterium]